MSDTRSLSLAPGKLALYKFLISLYPASYRRHYGQEMLILFRDMYAEELTKHGHTGLNFWLALTGDYAQSVVDQHAQAAGKSGLLNHLQRTFHINRYHIAGLILLLPALVVSAIDLGARIAQGDLFHYNRPVYAFMSHTPLYWFPILFIWVLVFPFLAVVINLIPVVRNASAGRPRIFSWPFIHRNLGSLLLLVLGLGFLAMIRLHDFAPCLVHGLFSRGFGQFLPLLQYCRTA